MNIRSASVPVNYEQTSATLIETNSLSRKGTSRGGGAINSRAATAKNFRIDQIVSIQNIATRYLFLRDIYFFFFFPPFFPTLPSTLSPLFFIIRFSSHEVRIKKHRKRFSFARELALGLRIYRTYISRK